MFYRLVSWSIFSQANGVVSPDKGNWQIHQCGESDRAAHVITKDEESATKRLAQTVERDSIKNSAHGVLADTKVDQATVRIGILHLAAGRQERFASFNRGVVTTSEVSRATPEFWKYRCNRCNDFARCGSGCHIFTSGEHGQGFCPIRWKCLVTQPL